MLDCELWIFTLDHLSVVSEGLGSMIRTARIAALLSVVGMGNYGTAATITWDSSAVFTGTGDILTSGPLVKAVNQGGPAAFYDINPFGNSFSADPIDATLPDGSIITFETRNDFPHAPYSSNGPAGSPFVDFGDAGFNEVINQAAWADNGTNGSGEDPWLINVFGLEVGTQY